MGSNFEDIYLDNCDGLNWERIAAAVSSEMGVSRNAQFCKLKWTNELHPRICRGTWSCEELSELQRLVDTAASTGTIDWISISKRLKILHRPTGVCWTAYVNI